ncbi:NAD(P)-dependent oxidoreductase [Caulobacter sp. S45]|uniref:NAD-dependent epimerase/dehydratase family protein n=1 Tax=Caulobacter sp. S45 TaxID=1641861 RepID=UPI00131E0D69|nr:NAD(P)-dependent oxidoreductase [Caulobacter sp. S45]
MAPSRKFVTWLADPNAKIAVIGASGWIGRAAVQIALDAGLDPAGGRLRLFASRPGAVEIAGRHLSVEALEGAPALGDGEWLVLHLAIVGPDRIEGADPERARPVNDALLVAAMRLAETGATRRFVFSSSGAVYGRPGADRTAYGEMKLAHEAALRDWGEQTRRPVSIARVFNIGGPYINHVANYALGDFIQSLRREGRIRIAASHGVFRSYVHVLELAQVIFHTALEEPSGVLSFDTAGGQVVEIGELAQAVGAAMGRPDVEILRPRIGDGRMDRYVGDGQAYQEALLRSGATPIDLETIIRDTARYLETAD